MDVSKISGWKNIKDSASKEIISLIEKNLEYILNHKFRCWNFLVKKGCTYEEKIGKYVLFLFQQGNGGEIYLSIRCPKCHQLEGKLEVSSREYTKEKGVPKSKEYYFLGENNNTIEILLHKSMQPPKTAFSIF